MAGCAACGACCEIISITGNQDNYRFLLRHSNPATADPVDREKLANARHIVEHFHPIDIETAARVNLQRVIQNVTNSFFTCDFFNTESKQCGKHEERPPMCREAPWYGRSPQDAWPLLTAWPQCSYWHDVDRALWPTFVDPLPDPLRSII